MKPYLLKRGNIPAMIDGGYPDYKLQWNHILSNVETFVATGEGQGCIMASMEPRSFKRGNLESKTPDIRMYTASMEPRSFKRGNRQASIRR